MKSLFLLSSILGLSLLTGCSMTYFVPQDPETEEFVDARDNLYLSSATVTLTGGTEISLDSTVLLPTSVSGVKEDSRVRHECPLSTVSEIRVTDVGRGAWRGGRGGLLAGIGLTLGAGAMLVGPQHDPLGQGLVLVAVGAGACTGLILGSIAGMAFLSTEHYQFTEEPVPNQEMAKHAWNSRSVKFLFAILPEETPEAVRITLEKRTIWLPKSKVSIERTNEGHILTVPEYLLEAEEDR